MKNSKLKREHRIEKKFWNCDFCDSTDVDKHLKIGIIMERKNVQHKNSLKTVLKKIEI